jgi:hypothetical protein
MDRIHCFGHFRSRLQGAESTVEFSLVADHPESQDEGEQLLIPLNGGTSADEHI